MALTKVTGEGLGSVSGVNLSSGNVTVIDGQGFYFGDGSYRIEGKDDGANARIGFVTNSSEIARFTSNGLTFNGDTAAANALDDYENGTFTPTWYGYPAPNATSGKYVKVGNQVTVYAKLVTDSGNDASSVGISNLPYTISGDLGAGSVYHNAINLFSKGLVTVFNSNSTTCFLETESGGSQVKVQYVSSNPQLGGFSTLIWILHYQTL